MRRIQRAWFRSRARPRWMCSLLFLKSPKVFVVGWLALSGCSILATRPVQEMSDTSAALRAAKEVQADTLAPDLYRQSNEWFFRAKQEYKFKNFDLARKYAKRARYYAENAEFQAIRGGGNRV